MPSAEEEYSVGTTSLDVALDLAFVLGALLVGTGTLSSSGADTGRPGR